MNVSQFLTTLAIACVPTGLLLAHDDDPKILDRQAPYQGAAFRRGQLNMPGGPTGGSLALGGNPFSASGVTLLSWLPLGEFGSPGTGADCWGYTSSSGREYGLFCHRDGTSIIDVTNPFNAQVVTTISGPESLWRDVKIYQNRAYIVSEGGSGIQVVNLNNIDNGQANLVGTITSGGSTSTHNVAINEESGYLYRTGGSGNGLRVYDLAANPTNPPFVGSWSTRYVHDAQVVSYTSGPYAGKEIAFCCSGFNNGGTATGLDVLDVTNKNNIQVLANVFYSNGAYSHQGWLSEDRQYFFLGDELDENGSLPTTTYIMDVSNLNSPFQAGSFTNGKQAVGHNLYTVGDLIYEANYRSGLRIFNASNPLNPQEVAWFDTYPEDDNDGFNGLWSVYPYFESGTIIGSDLERGFFVLYLGDIPLTLSFQGTPPTLVDPAGEGVDVSIVEASPGDYLIGSAMLHVDVGGNWTSYQMTDLGGGNFRADFPSLPCGTSFQYYISADSTSGGTWAEPQQAPSSLFSAVASLGTTNLASDNLEAASGWTSGVGGDSASTGIWERVNPNGTDAQPENDHSQPGTQCWVTGQGSVGGSIGENDVDNGSTTLLSPAYDLSSASSPSISYWRWFTNDGNGSVDDDFVVEIRSNGGAWVEVERLGPGHPEASGGWFQKSIAVTNYVATSASVQLRFIASDTGSGSIVEAAIDDLSIDDADCGGCSGQTMTNYCSTSPNSVGSGALISGTGTTSLSANDFNLYVFGAVPGAFGLYYYGGAQTATLFGDGIRCVAAGSTGIYRLNPPQTVSVFGDLPRSVDYTAPPMNSGGGMISEGETWFFQFWYRDTAAGGSGFNLSDGLEVIFCP
jgi:choice-of-anchor B domain-containing protein